MLFFHILQFKYCEKHTGRMINLNSIAPRLDLVVELVPCCPASESSKIALSNGKTPAPARSRAPPQWQPAMQNGPARMINGTPYTQAIRWEAEDEEGLGVCSAICCIHALRKYFPDISGIFGKGNPKGGGQDKRRAFEEFMGQTLWFQQLLNYCFKKSDCIRVVVLFQLINFGVNSIFYALFCYQ